MADAKVMIGWCPLGPARRFDSCLAHMTKNICPYCGKNVVVVHSSVIYGKGHNYGTMRACQDFPACDSYAGMGASLADRELRELRKRCHKLFDMRWKTGRMSRSECYNWLKQVMKMTAQQAHIANFRNAERLKLLEIIDPNRSLIKKTNG